MSVDKYQKVNISRLINGNIVRISSNSKYIAYASGIHVNIIDSSHLKTLCKFSCIDKVDNCEFSQDSEKVLCFIKERCIIQCFSLVDNDWKCRIDEGMPGITNAYWSSDSLSIITESGLGIQLSIWSLTTAQKYIISYPKIDIWNVKDIWKPQLTSFSDSENGHLFAVVHRHEMRDYIAIYSQQPVWEELLKFQCYTSDVAVVEWLPGRSLLLTCDSPLSNTVVIYYPSGEVLGSYTPYQYALGVRSLSMHPFTNNHRFDGLCNQLFATGSFDGKVRLVTYSEASEAFVLPLDHPNNINSTLKYPQHHPAPTNLGEKRDDPIDENQTKINSSKGSILMEILGSSNLDMDKSMKRDNDENDQINLSRNSAIRYKTTESRISNRNMTSIGLHSPTRKSMVSSKLRSKSSSVLVSTLSETYFAIRDDMKQLPSISIDARDAKDSLRMGVSWLNWSFDGKFLAAREDTQPRCLWIWSMQDEVRLLHVIINLDVITCAQWRPATAQHHHNNELDSQDFLQNTWTTGQEGQEPSDDTVQEDTRNKSSLLAYCTGSPRVYFWDPLCNNSLPYYTDVLPSLSSDNDGSIRDNESKLSSLPISIYRLEWSKDGSYLMLYGKENFYICRLQSKQFDDLVSFDYSVSMW